MLTTDQAFILADVSISSASVISQGYHTFWGPVTTWQHFLVQELIRRDNNELPLAVGTGRYWDMQQTPPYPDEYSVFISESDTVNEKGFADTLSLGTLLPPTSSVHTLPQDMADDSDADSVIMIFVNTSATTFSYAYLTDSASLSIINYNANQNTTNWVKTYSTGNNLSPYAVVNRFTNGDVLIGINEHAVDTFGFQSSAIHWLLLDSDVSISTPEFHTTNHNNFIFPNPAADVLHIHGLVASESYSYSILDVSGRVVSNGSLIDDSVDLNSLNLTAGMYFIALESETSGSVQTFEFVIE
ncbi:T9SS type A sorting domain-containing protein [Phaeocystidibacter luteus]|nr:T9SS type A sorting domain-containing protein [Phaeocystidibacter luteus]